MKKHLLFTLFTGVIMIDSATAAGGGKCAQQFDVARYYKPATVVNFEMRGMKIASVTDDGMSTGATLFYFPRGANANFDSRGGSVASVETTLLEEGSYSNQIDGIVFAGGSTMGLAATDGVRKAIFDARKEVAGDFDFIPGVPGAVVYDYAGRLAPFNDPYAYPNHDMGLKLMENLRTNEFSMGRAGAGINTTCNKLCDQPRWGGQGLAHKKVRIEGREYNIVAAVVLNAVGDVYDGNESVSERFVVAGEEPAKKPVPKGHKKNTTLSIIVTDLPMDRNQLKRIAVMAHTGMAAQIRPFHSSTDGDIMFTVSTGGNATAAGEAVEEFIATEASELMGQAILGAVEKSNTPR